MKPRIATAVMLFIASYSPLFFVLTMKDYNFDLGQFANPSRSIGILVLSLLSIIVSVILLRIIPKGSYIVKILSVENRSGDFLNYSIPYLLSFLGNDLSDIHDTLALVVFLSIMLIVSLKTHAIFINPLLVIAGYSLFDIEYEYDENQRTVLVLSKMVPKVGAHYHLAQLTSGLDIIRGDENEIIGQTEETES